MADAASKKVPSINLATLWLMNADGDVDDINSVVNSTCFFPFGAKKKKKLWFTLCLLLDIQWDAMPAKEVVKHWIKHTHCSVIIKVTPDLSDLYSSHTTWSSYTFMLRHFKSYNLKFNSNAVKSQKVVFSSYPGYVGSVDDWYVTSSHLVVTETTNGFFNTSLYQFVKPQSNLSWLRAVVANRFASHLPASWLLILISQSALIRMAASGPQWVEVFSQYNSGTYCNQWIVIDYNLFRPLRDLPPNTLTIAEQIPGSVMSADVTSYLSLGYWCDKSLDSLQRIVI